jgi:hypothetical protein
MAAIVAGGYATCPKTGLAADVTAFYDGVLSFSGLEIPVFASGLMAATPEDEKGAWNACSACVGGGAQWVGWCVGARECTCRCFPFSSHLICTLVQMCCHGGH